MPTGQPKQLTVQDIINSDPRTAQLKKNYEALVTNKNNLILTISHVESDIIAKMGAFSYLNAFTDVDDAKNELLPDFRALVTKKRQLIDAIRGQEAEMKNIEGAYNSLAQEIVNNLKKQFNQSAPESCPESCPDCQNGQCEHCGKDCENHVHPDVELPKVPGAEGE